MDVSGCSTELDCFGCVILVKRARFLWLCHVDQGRQISMVLPCWSTELDFFNLGVI